MKSNKNFLRSWILLLVWILFLFLMKFVNFESSLFIINILFIILTFLFSIFFGDVWEKKKHRVKTYQTLCLMICIYELFYFGLGFLFGFSSIPRSSVWLTCHFVLFLFLLDILRNRFVKQVMSQSVLALLCALLMFSVSLSFFTLITIDEILILLFLCIFESFLLTKIAFFVGIRPILVYRCLLLVPLLIVSVTPKIPTFFFGMLFTLFLFFIWMVLKKEYEEEKTFQLNQNKPFLFLGITSLLIVILLLTTGKLNYQLYAIASNSMKPEFQRGDIVFFKRIPDGKKNQIKIGDILVYKTKERIIVHRVVEKQYEDGAYSFITKGDANELVDEKRVKESDVLGVVKTHISYLGYPTVWLHEG